MVANRLTGEEIEEVKELASAHFWPHARMAGDMSEDSGLKLAVKAKGVWVEDADGKQWFDTLAGMWLKNIGHGRKEIADAVYQQMQDIMEASGCYRFITNGVMPQIIRKTITPAFQPDGYALLRGFRPSQQRT